MKIFSLLIVLVTLNTAWAQPSWNNTPVTARFLGEADTIVDQTLNPLGCISRMNYIYYYYIADSTYTSDTLFVFSSDDPSKMFAVKVWEYDSKEAADIGGFPDSTLLVDRTQDTVQYITHALTKDKVYLLRVALADCSLGFVINNGFPGRFRRTRREPGCPGCLGGFRPTGGQYILSAWVKDEAAALGTVDYDKPHIEVTSGVTVTDCTISGEIIDGWQRIEKEVTVEEGESVAIELVCNAGGSCLFDDIRFFPKDASMVTYVYDPITLRLMAELDERNYAKIYEYDEQGKLVRVKKETEMGIMTIQENRENNSKE